MIELILGENTYLADVEMRRLIRESTLEPEYIDTTKLTANGLADLIRGNSLFHQRRLIILRELSREQPELWRLLAEWAQEVGDETTVILVEAKPDKRTKAYKMLAAHAQLHEVKPLTQRDTRQAEEWLAALARSHDLKLSRAQLSQMISRAMIPGEKLGSFIIDQLQLYHAVLSLKGSDVIDDEMIAVVLPAPLTANVFDLLEYALERRPDALRRILDQLHGVQDPYQIFSILAGQWTQYVAVCLGEGNPAQLATELGMHPFVVGRFQKLSRLVSRAELRQFTVLAADLDSGMKRSQFTPWDGVERFVSGIALRP